MASAETQTDPPPAFVTKEYNSYSEFELCFDRYMKENNCVFRKQSSESAHITNLKTKHKIGEGFQYSRCVFICTHFGQPRYRGQGIKKQSKTKLSATGCEAYFTLNYDYYDKVMKITKYHLEHNHPTTAETYAKEYKVRRLKPEEMQDVQEIVRLIPDNRDLLHIINTKYNKAFSLKDIRRLKYQCRQADLKTLYDGTESKTSANQPTDTAKDDVESSQTIESTSYPSSDEFQSSECHSSTPPTEKPQSPSSDAKICRFYSRKRSSTTADFTTHSTSKPQQAASLQSQELGQQTVSFFQLEQPLPESGSPSLNEIASNVRNANNIASFLAYLAKRDEEALKLRKEEVDLRKQEIELRKQECLMREREVELHKQRLEFDRSERKTLLDLLRVQMQQIVNQQSAPEEVGQDVDYIVVKNE